MSIHQRTHPTYVEGCWNCRVSTVVVGAVSGPVRETADREKVLDKDMAAYKRMRRAGMSPAHLAGSAVVEKEARSPIEVEHPRLIGLSDQDRKHAADAARVATDLHPLLKEKP